MDEDWNVVRSFLPPDWKTLAADKLALKGLRKDKSPERLLRTLLLHVACGYSLRETAVRARRAGLADMSDVALLKRLRKSKEWLRALCAALFARRGIALEPSPAFEVRVFDSTVVKEPGQTGSQWRIHYSLRLPSLRCDFFKLTATKGEGNGESFRQFPIEAGDRILADRGYSAARGIGWVDEHGGELVARLNTSGMRLRALDGSPFDLAGILREQAREAAVAHAWPAEVFDDEGVSVSGRICAVRKSREAAAAARKKLLRQASKKGHRVREKTLFFSQYVIVFTTFCPNEFSPADVLQWYRLRWQVELVFKRFKQIARMGHLPKHDEESAQAWLYGKLVTALLAEEMIECADRVSPWGYEMCNAQSLA